MKSTNFSFWRSRLLQMQLWNVIFLWDLLSIVRRLAIFVNRTVVSNLFPKSFLTNTKLLQSWGDFVAPSIKMSKEIYYSDKYEDDKYEYRHVMLPKVTIINWFDFFLIKMSFQGSCKAGAQDALHVRAGVEELGCAAKPRVKISFSASPTLCCSRLCLSQRI